MYDAEQKPSAMAYRFRGFLPVVVDVETAGFDANKDALLEIAAIILRVNENGQFEVDEQVFSNIIPFKGANLDPKALEFTGIDPYHPFRFAVEEKEALDRIFQSVRQAVKEHDCTRAILVGHNAFFDLQFLNAAVKRTGIKRNPFHGFSSFDTVSLAGLMYGQTVLARAVQAAGLDWDNEKAHSALYDAERTAQLFCTIVNRWDGMKS